MVSKQQVIMDCWSIIIMNQQQPASILDYHCWYYIILLTIWIIFKVASTTI